MTQEYLPINTSHVDDYFAVLGKKASLRIVPHLAENIVLLGPFFPEPTAGKDAVVKVLSGFLGTIASPVVNLRFASEQDVAVFFSFTCNGLNVKGNEHLHLNEEGLIDSIEVAWRRLPATVQVQEVVTTKISFPVMRLVPAPNA